MKLRLSRFIQQQAQHLPQTHSLQSLLLRKMMVATHTPTSLVKLKMVTLERKVTYIIQKMISIQEKMTMLRREAR